MAFDFLGTLSQEQLRDLRSFLQEEMNLIDQQINTIIIEITNAEKTRQDLLQADNNFGGDFEKNIIQIEKELPDVVAIADQSDTNSALLIDKIKKPFISNIKFKRERLEFKIKKMIDYIEQLSEEVDRKSIAKIQTNQFLNEIEQLFNNKNQNHLFATTQEMRNFKKGVT